MLAGAPFVAFDLWLRRGARQPADIERMKAWLDFSGHAHGAKDQPALAAIFARLSAKDAIGRCTKCHSIDSDAGIKTIAWRPFSPDLIKNRFTTFSHRQHIAAVGAKGCQACHDLKTGSDDFLKTYAQGVPGNYTPNFKPMNKALCARCHAQQTAWQACTLCHRYHVEGIDARAAPIDRRREHRRAPARRE